VVVRAHASSPISCVSCRRDGDDLLFSKRVSLSEALCGTEFAVQTLDGRSLKVSTQDQIIQPGAQKVLR
jgi:DnaJ-class molecular chaperone